MTRRNLPAEWAPQSAVMLTWPHADSDWGPTLPQVEPVFVDIARHVAMFERVIIGCKDEAQRRHIAAMLERQGVSRQNVALYLTPSNDTWARDHGPITVFDDGQPRLLDFIFNGWGGKFDARLDNQITPTLHAQGAFGKTPCEPVDLVLEGGSIESDGAGTILTTKRCLLAPTRNSQLTQQEVEQRLAALFGVDRFLWLEHGYLAGDDTDSHIDTLARLCDPQTICYVNCDDPRDEHYRELNAMAAELRALRTRDGAPYRLFALPWPEAKFNDDGQRLPATYANFLIINQAVLVPTYEDAADAAALAVIQKCFPQRRIIGVPCLPLINQFGSLHCVTMQLPLGVV